MSRFDYDMFVIGAGSGGVRAARLAAGFGARIGIAEQRYLGGTCVNVGCVPKKLFVHASHYGEDFRDAAGFGWRAAAPAFNWQTLLQNKDAEIRRLNEVYRKLLSDSGAALFEQRAALADANTVVVGGRRLTAERVLIATGGWPTVPDIPGREHVITSNEVFRLQELPEKIIIVGGGYIAVEFAGVFHGLGVDTTLVYRGDLILRGFDVEVRRFLQQDLEKKGITLRLGQNIRQVEKRKQLTATFSDGAQQEAGLILYATGRHPNSADLGLEEAGVAVDEKGAVIVNDEYQTNVASIYALGDVTNRVNLTPVAIAEGAALANRLFNRKAAAVDYRDIPTCVFSQPALAGIGLTEEQAAAEYGAIAVHRSVFRPLKHTLSGNEERALFKIIVEKAGDRVVGAHIVSAEAGEIIQGIAIAIKAGATKAVFDATIGIHPTAAEEFVSMG